VEKTLNKYLKECQEGRHETSILTTQSEDSISPDDKTIWRKIRKELEDIGITLAAFNANQEFIMQWFRTALEAGSFDEQPQSTDQIDVTRGTDGLDLSDTESLLEAVERPRPHPDSPVKNSTLSRNSTSLLPKARSSESSSTSKNHRGDISFQKASNQPSSPTAATRPHRKEATRTLSGRVPRVEERPKRIPALFQRIFRYEESFLEACAVGDTGRARKLLAKGVDIEVTTLSANPLDNLAAPSKLFGNTALFIAAFNGDTSTTRMLLENGASIEKSNCLGETALHASFGGRVITRSASSVVRCLLNNGANPNVTNFEGQTALHLALHIDSGVTSTPSRLAIIGLLCNSGANINLMELDGDAALHIAIYMADNDAVKILLRNGADPNLLQQNSRRRPSRDGSPHHPTLTRYNSYQPRRSVHLDLPSLESYRPDSLKHKSNNKYKGIPRTPLCLAIDNSNLAIVNLLLEAGANPNLTPPGYADPLLEAVTSGLKGIVKALLRKGADASSATRNTSLTEAIKLGHVAIVALLLEHGAKVNPPQTNSLAGTPLHLAIRHCTINVMESVEWYDIVKILLQEGANPNMLDNDGMSSLHLAIIKGLSKVVEVLVENGADAELQVGQAPNAAGHIYLTQSDQSLLTPLQLAINPGATINLEHRPSALVFFPAKTKKMVASESISRVTNEDIVDILLEGGANPNTNLKDRKDSPIERARASGNSRVVRALLSHGAEILTRRGDLAGKWALFYLWENEGKPKRGSRLQMRRCALSESRVGIAQAFIDCGGADVHAKNRDNQTILHVAAKMKCVSMVKFCLEKGVDVTAKDKHGRIARQYALDTEMINLFVVDQPTNTNLQEATDNKDRKQARSPQATRISRPKKGMVSSDSL